MSSEKIEEILREFDFASVHHTMLKTKWTWASSDFRAKIPDLETIRKSARKLLEYVCVPGQDNISSGGFRATKDLDGHIELLFVVAEYCSEEGEDEEGREEKRHQCSFISPVENLEV